MSETLDRDLGAIRWPKDLGLVDNLKVFREVTQTGLGNLLFVVTADLSADHKATTVTMAGKSPQGRVTALVESPSGKHFDMP